VDVVTALLLPDLLGGGHVRDVVIGDFPPLAYADWHYSVTAAAAALLVFFYHPQLARIPGRYSCSTPPGSGCSPRPAR
jgi:uncharacterized membrane protein YeiH